jgi:chromosome segregation ATPase
MHEMCAALEKQNKGLAEQLDLANDHIQGQDREVEESRNEVQATRERLEDMQAVIDQCSVQMHDFD